jgi:hypothetical protein
MATVNLGSIKFKWKGTYSGATAYTIDDVVEYNGSSYICILASTGNLPTNATYFEQMSSAGTNGTNGTDLTTTLITQGDIVYRDGSGLQRLGAGTAGQLLQTGGAGANISWTNAPSNAVQKMESYTYTTRATLPNSAGKGIFNTITSGTFNKQLANSKITVIITATMYQETNGSGNTNFQLGTSNDVGQHFYGIHAGSTKAVTFHYYIPNNTQTGTLTWNWGYDFWGGTLINPDSQDDNRLIDGENGTVITIWEYV